eukprot:COSAG02_NODE_13_length_57813_cov_14.298276_39_plen_82_part_00
MVEVGGERGREGAANGRRLTNQASGACWRVRVLQEYDQHLAAVNSITFTDGGRRFLTSSDDKSMRVWEYGIPVVMKVRDTV